MSEIPHGFDKVKKLGDPELLRIGAIAELDAVNLYEQLAANASDTGVKKLFTDIAHEEKVHMGEFISLLFRLDPEQVADFEKGRKEVQELLAKP
jgi:rubrerythrin